MLSSSISNWQDSAVLKKDKKVYGVCACGCGVTFEVRSAKKYATGCAPLTTRDKRLARLGLPWRKDYA